METISNRIEWTTGVTLPSRTVYYPCSFLLSGLLSLYIRFQKMDLTFLKDYNSILFFFVCGYEDWEVSTPLSPE